jgi:hypothetical protein
MVISLRSKTYELTFDIPTPSTNFTFPAVRIDSTLSYQDVLCYFTNPYTVVCCNDKAGAKMLVAYLQKKEKVSLSFAFYSTFSIITITYVFHLLLFLLVIIPRLWRALSVMVT